MPRDHEIVKLSGKITDIFVHRFVVESTNGKFLADFGKHNMETVSVKAGDAVELEGEQKPSELKIHKIWVNGAKMEIKPKDKDKHKKHDHDKHEHNE